MLLFSKLIKRNVGIQSSFLFWIYASGHQKKLYIYYIKPPGKLMKTLMHLRFWMIQYDDNSHGESTRKIPYTLRRNSIVPVPKRRKRATSPSHSSKRHDVVVDMGLFREQGSKGRGGFGNMLETLRDTERVWTMNEVGRVRTLSSRTSWTSIK